MILLAEINEDRTNMPNKTIKMCMKIQWCDYWPLLKTVYKRHQNITWLSIKTLFTHCGNILSGFQLKKCAIKTVLSYPTIKSGTHKKCWQWLLGFLREIGLPFNSGFTFCDFDWNWYWYMSIFDPLVQRDEIRILSTIKQRGYQTSAQVQNF